MRAECFPIRARSSPFPRRFRCERYRGSEPVDANRPVGLTECVDRNELRPFRLLYMNYKPGTLLKLYGSGCFYRKQAELCNYPDPVRSAGNCMNLWAMPGTLFFLLRHHRSSEHSFGGHVATLETVAWGGAGVTPPDYAAEFLCLLEALEPERNIAATAAMIGFKEQMYWNGEKPVLWFTAP